MRLEKFWLGTAVEAVIGIVMLIEKKDPDSTPEASPLFIGAVIF